MDFLKIAEKLTKQSKHIQKIQTLLQAPKRITVVAHRGGPAMGAHENTMAAFEKAIECGADMIETDLRRTRDGVIVCHHDAHIGKEKIADLSYAEANKLAKSKGYDIPHLRSLLALAHGRIQLDLELKEVGYELDVIDQVRDMLKPDAFVMKSFNDSSVYTIKEIDPRIITGLLVDKSPYGNKPLDTVAKLSYEARIALTKADFLGPEVALVNKTLVTRMRLLGKKIFVWTPNSDIEIQHLIDLGVDAIITDCPDKALSLLNR
jgi:glycerophosphoryl diester phosphodiesterase